MEKKKVLYIVNPRSGIGKKKIIENEIVKRSDKETVAYEIVHTTHRGHAKELAEAAREEVDVVVAVGGDGTVNEVGSSLVWSRRTALGIIPTGSGNGLARELDIPMRASLAVDVINEFCTRQIDIMTIDGNISLNVAGVGFDAYISHKFADKKTRGPLQYMNLITKEFPEYEPEQYVLDIDGHIYQRTAFLISFANSSQWGNNIHIAPNAQMDDGLIDVCIVSEFPNTAIPSLLISLLSQSIDDNKYDEIIRTKSLQLRNEQPIMGHVDGEPVIIGPMAKVEISPLALKVVTPSAGFYAATRFNPSKIREQIINTVREPIDGIRKRLEEL